MGSAVLNFDAVMFYGSIAIPVAGLVLALVFRGGRAAFAFLTLAWAWLCLHGDSVDPWLTFTVGAHLPETAIIFTGINLLALTLSREFALVSMRSVYALAALTAQSLLGLYLSSQSWAEVSAMERTVAQLLAGTAYPAPNLSSIFWLVAAPVALSRWYVGRDPLHLGLGGAALLAGIGVYQVTAEVASVTWFFAAGLALVAALGLSAYRDAFSDKLTELPGRFLLDQNLSKLGRRYAVALLDVDLLRRFNHRYGHSVGDQVLRLVSSRLRQRFGGNAYHFGGEEFCVIFSGLQSRFALSRCDAFRAEIERHQFVLRGRDRPIATSRGRRGDELRRRGVHVTISIGVAHRDGHHASSSAVMSTASKALHRAKQLGRNLVVEQKRAR